MKVLLTGAAGFIGTAIARELNSRGAEVVCVDLMLEQAHGNTLPPEGIHQLDVRDARQWAHLLDGVDVVCHQAAVVGAGANVADLPLYASHNDLGTAALLAAMHERNVSSLVLASSMVVYGEGLYSCVQHGIRRPQPRATADLDAGVYDPTCPDCGARLAWELVGEDAPLDPRSAYAASKLAQEHYASAWARATSSSVIALRYHNVYGPGMPRDTPYSGVAAMFRSSLERGLAPQVYEDGAQTRDFVHVHDIARANALAIEAAGEHDTGLVAYNVCSGRPVTIGQVAELVSSGTEANLTPEVTGAYRLGDVRHVVASPQRAAHELGFIAAVDPTDGLPAFATEPLREG
ncbi:NAD-dependent epimerase/dehydratase family protein [Demetria terragena]|uniref:NAD-dependent epimerase/dehydratase family protein n=1 Tax=Demetria terragena TaxID=63959 RepID=UPI0004757509|nr:NAD-dependent epimerase/dehydratase family protein [Demetria terragena]